MTSMLKDLESQLRALRKQHLYRSLKEPSGLDFSSNDYLGISGDPGFLRCLMQSLEREGDLFSPASRLLRGNTRQHQDLEARLARFKGTESALLFSSGYLANIGLLTTLITPQDRVLSDAQNHASLIDGLRLSGCQRDIFEHCNWRAVERLLQKDKPAGRTFLVTESLFSMDGDVAPIPDYLELVERHGAELIVDDAHATGIYGSERGSGLIEEFQAEDRVLAVVSTLGKAVGVSGAFVAGPKAVVSTLVNRCRTFIFSTALPPLLVRAIECSLDFVEANPDRRERVIGLADRLRVQLVKAGLDTCSSSGPIVPVILSEVDRVMAVAEVLQAEGFDVRPIRPPTVRPGTARLRISVHANHRSQDVDGLAQFLIAATQIPCEGLNR